MRKYVVSISVAILSGLAFPASASESLCKTAEKVFFACRLGKKIVSICASKDYPAPSSTFQYRFGSRGAIEMAWPEPATSRAGVAFGNQAYAGGGLGYIRFVKEDIEYVVYSGVGHDWEADGIMVLKNGKRVANHSCKNAAEQDLWHTRLPEDTQAVEDSITEQIH